MVPCFSSSLVKRFRSTVGKLLFASLGLFVDFDLLAPHVLLDFLNFLNDLLSDADLLLNHRPLLDHHLFLHDGYHYLVFLDPRARSLSLSRDGFPLDGDTLHRYLNALLGHHDRLVIGPHALAHPHSPDLALAGSDPELLLRTPHPKLFSHEVATGLGYALSVVLSSADLARLGRDRWQAADSLARACALSLR